ncbi:hypothetical protein SUGI_0592130 [Cryptomeria japonica]|nr:hypothetical protein SUGI_0592130 [Cryptomeria japonica]
MKNAEKILLIVMCITLVSIKGKPLNGVNTDNIIPGKSLQFLNTGGAFAAKAAPPHPKITGLVFPVPCSVTRFIPLPCTKSTDHNPQITEFCTCKVQK